jgi:hypothetical protein
VDEFSSIQIDQDEDVDEDKQNLNFQNMIVGHKILQFPTNHIPKGLVPLEIFFYHNDVPVKPPDPEKEADVTDCNLGTAANPKHVKLSKFLSGKQRARYEKFIKEFIDIFAWKYEDLRTFDVNIIQHKIPLKENVKPFKKKLRQINPLLLPIMEKEVKKLLDAKIIVPLRYSDWIEKMVPVRKNNGEIRLCVDFRNLNRCSWKDNYPLPKMEHILQRVVGSSKMSMIDGFFGYNQVVVHLDDMEKTAFKTPWDTFMYSRMPFGLMNAGATFQRAMDIAFVGEKDKFVVIYLDEIIVFSIFDEEHLHHLR